MGVRVDPPVIAFCIGKETTYTHGLDGLDHRFELELQVRSMMSAGLGSRLRFFVEDPARLGSSRAAAVGCTGT